VRETEYIVRLAREGEGRIVTLGPLLLFSTPSGDAWVLDLPDGHAHCLPRDGSHTPLAIEDRGQQIAIDWPGSYEIRGETFTFADSREGTRTVLGYPTREIQAAAAKLPPPAPPRHRR